jgi:hypothetical protein
MRTVAGYFAFVTHRLGSNPVNCNSLAQWILLNYAKRIRIQGYSFACLKGAQHGGHCQE